MSEVPKISPWATIVSKVLDWLKQVGPSAMALGMIVFRYMKRKLWRAEREIEKKEMEIAHHENKAKVERDNAGKSNADIVHDAIDAGKRLRDKEPRVPNKPGRKV